MLIARRGRNFRLSIPCRRYFWADGVLDVASREVACTCDGSLMSKDCRNASVGTPGCCLRPSVKLLSMDLAKLGKALTEPRAAISVPRVGHPSSFRFLFQFSHFAIRLISLFILTPGDNFIPSVNGGFSAVIRLSPTSLITGRAVRWSSQQAFWLLLHQKMRPSRGMLHPYLTWSTAPCSASAVLQCSHMPYLTPSRKSRDNWVL